MTGASPRLISCYFGTGAGNQWPRLARVLEFSARRQCPAWEIEVHAIAPTPCASGLHTPSHEHNTQKLDHWVDVATRAPDGSRIALLDADTVIVRPLDAVWDISFDLAYTRREKSRLPLNAGVVFMRVTERSRAFLYAWRDENRRMLRDRVRHAEWRRKYGGMNQAALGCLFESGIASTLNLVALACREWNCEDSCWSTFDPAVARIVHIKSGLRRALFLRAIGINPAIRPLFMLWRQLEREATA
jgi:hypothetical protein